MFIDQFFLSRLLLTLTSSTEYRGSREKPQLDVTTDYHPWLLVTVIACLGGALWVALCTLVVWLYRRRRRRRSHKSNREATKYDNRQISKTIVSLFSHAPFEVYPSQNSGLQLRVTVCVYNDVERFFHSISQSDMLPLPG